MKVKCIEVDPCKILTLDQEYQVVEESTLYYKVDVGTFNKRRFVVCPIDNEQQEKQS